MSYVSRVTRLVFVLAAWSEFEHGIFLLWRITVKLILGHHDANRGSMLCVRFGWKEFSVSPGLVTQQILLFANPAVPDLPGARGDDEATST